MDETKTSEGDLIPRKLAAIEVYRKMRMIQGITILGVVSYFIMYILAIWGLYVLIAGVAGGAIMMLVFFILNLKQMRYMETKYNILKK